MPREAWVRGGVACARLAIETQLGWWSTGLDKAVESRQAGRTDGRAARRTVVRQAVRQLYLPPGS